MKDECKRLFHSRFLRIWHNPRLFSLGITIDTKILFVTVEIGTLQFIIGH